MTTRLYKRVTAAHPVALSIRATDDHAGAEGEAFLTNLSPSGLCLVDVKWKRETSLTDHEGQFDVHIPLPDWVGIDVKVRPVRIRFSDDSLEIGAVIVRPPARLKEALQALGFAGSEEDDGDPIS